MSLRLRLLLLIGVSLSVLWGGVAAWTLRDLDRQLRHTLDQRLAMSAQMVAGLMAQLPPPSPGAMSTLPAINAGIACQIVSVRGEILAQTPGAPVVAQSRPPIGYADQLIDGVHWRSYTVESAGLRVTTADRLTERSVLLAKVRWAAGIPFIVALAGSLVAVWFGVRRGLLPLERLRQALARRAPDALEPVDARLLPGELLPLTNSLNLLLSRMVQMLARERRLTSDAAHELRTPLTAIKTHLQVARITQGQDAATALDHAEEGADRLQHTLTQLLTLARVEGPFDWDDGQQARADQVVRLAVRDAAPGQPQRFAMGELATIDVALPQALAVTALRNLLDNALRYSPADSTVKVDARLDHGAVHFCVIDHGPGLSADELLQATQRFWRGNTANHDGSGLGLAIVAAIARRFGGELRLDAHPGGGLQAMLTLPIVDPAR
ncbi:ATP-binding protein [Jeongeupia wiesaeckerbachi]|uniref:ATP-binding protein n=1 Tax=Jeongeupia wiesaeckerbachi TaxID=3051218 RepID=UPI003D807544